MRSRRRSRSRREPLFWSRTCYETDGVRTGPDDIADCGDTEVTFGVVLFDPVVAQLNTTEARITVRKLLWPSAVFFNTLTATTPAGMCWVVVVKSGQDLTTLTGLTLSALLESSIDVLDVKVFPIGNVFTGGTNAVLQGGTLNYTNAPQPWEINVSRKMEGDDKIVALMGFTTQFHTSLGAGLGYTGAFEGIISVLWQRTLR